MDVKPGISHQIVRNHVMQEILVLTALIHVVRIVQHHLAVVQLENVLKQKRLHKKKPSSVMKSLRKVARHVSVLLKSGELIVQRIVPLVKMARQGDPLTALLQLAIALVFVVKKLKQCQHATVLRVSGA
jgi:hypothetical protein